jgi:chitinase
MKSDMLKKVRLNADFLNLKSNLLIMCYSIFIKRFAFKKQFTKIALVLSSILFSFNFSYAQLPANVLVGYHENWSALSLIQTGAGLNYNVINLAFGLPITTGPTGACTCDIRYALPPAYGSIAAMNTDIDALHAAGKKVILSLGGATGPIILSNAANTTTFINSVNAIFAAYSYKIDGLDLDLETTSMTSIASTWTMAAPAPEQTNMVTAIQSIAASYQTNHPTHNRMLLTMAPEVYYLNGALSAFQVTASGGVFLPILVGLSAQLDLLQMQLYNSPGGVNAWNGTTYFEATGDFVVAMNETVVKGFTLLAGKGTFAGIPASKIGFGLPANTAAAGSGFVSYSDICLAVKYFKGTIAKPAGWTYNMTAAYPTLKGLMTWDINLDLSSSTPVWGFASNYTCSFPAPVTLISFTGNRSNENVYLNWITADETNNDYYSLERSSDGISFSEITKIKGLGTSSQGKAYNYTDTYSSMEDVYYRLAQYDMDGVVHYSSVITVTAANTKAGLLIQNNPFQEILYVLPYGENNKDAIINILDYSGKLMASKTVKTNEEIALGADLQSGLYFLQFVNNGEITNYKVIKQ